MIINIDTDTESKEGLAAIAALIASLRGESSTVVPNVTVAPPLARDIPNAPSMSDGTVIEPAPIQTAPVAPPPPVSLSVPTASPAAGDVDRDSTGLPWDARIHAESKAKTDKNVWRRRRGVDDATVAAVIDELRSANAARTIEAAAPLVAPPPPPVVVPNDPDAAFAEPTPVAPPPPTTTTETAVAPVAPPPPAPVVVAANDAITPDIAGFAKLTKKIAGLETSGAIAPSRKAEICAELGIDSVRVLATRFDMLAAFDALLGA